MDPSVVYVLAVCGGVDVLVLSDCFELRSAIITTTSEGGTE